MSSYEQNQDPFEIDKETLAKIREKTKEYIKSMKKKKAKRDRLLNRLMISGTALGVLLLSSLSTDIYLDGVDKTYRSRKQAEKACLDWFVDQNSGFDARCKEEEITRQFIGELWRVRKFVPEYKEQFIEWVPTKHFRY